MLGKGDMDNVTLGFHGADTVMWYTKPLPATSTLHKDASSSPSCSTSNPAQMFCFQLGLLLIQLGKQQKVAQVLGPLYHVRDM